MEATSTRTISNPDLEKIVDRIAVEQGVESPLVHSVIRAESNYNPNAVSPKGAQGLMQLIPSTARRFGVSNPFDVAENIQGGVRYLRFLLDYYQGDYPKAIAAYNAGEGAVDKYHGVPPYIETQTYVRRVAKGLEAGCRKPASPSPAPLNSETPGHILASVGTDGRISTGLPERKSKLTMLWRMSWAVAVFGLLPALAAEKPGIIQVTGVRSWSHSDSTRVIIETTGSFEYKADRAHDPERLYLDIPHSRPWISNHRFATRQIADSLVNRVRVAEQSPGTTRVVFDLKAPSDFTITRLDAPDRLVVELRSLHPEAPLTPVSARPAFVYPPVAYSPLPRRPQIVFAGTPPALPESNIVPVNLTDWSPAAQKSPRQIRAVSTQIIPAAKPAIPSDSMPLASENASRSLTRALGLKVNRIVIDAGHGGHDDGTIGPHGVLEKDVVLDVALRLSKLVQQKMGAEVVLTRSDDTFIPLRDRTALANDHKADLFLSIHANSSPAPEVAGTETFYLNFTNVTGSLDVAARENAGSDKTVGELKDLIQSITLNDKIEESHTFAQDVQNSIQLNALHSNAAAHNRGVKRAPFVVLIGASMPSVLAEIGFLSNSRDEANLGKPEYRQKVAEALYKGLAQYSQSLSHFQPARQVAKAY